MKSILLTTILLISTLAEAQWSERFELNYRDQEFQGQSTLFLKRDLNQQHPYLRLQDYDIDSVQLFAKSRHGQGDATLVVSGRSSYSQNIPGRPNDFYNSSEYTFYTMNFHTPSYQNDNGPWQIQMRGNNIVRRAIVYLNRNHGGGGGGGGYDIPVEHGVAAVADVMAENCRGGWDISKTVDTGLVFSRIEGGQAVFEKDFDMGNTKCRGVNSNIIVRVTIRVPSHVATKNYNGFLTSRSASAGGYQTDCVVVGGAWRNACRVTSVR